MLSLTDYHQYLGRRLRDANKANFGHVVVVGGDYGMFGAPYLSAIGALRSGAGLVTVATRDENATRSPHLEIMTHAIISNDRFQALLDRATVVVIGPGLGQSLWAKAKLDMVIQSHKPMIIDADGLNLLAEIAPVVPREHQILTPHPGEAARLLKTTVADIQADRKKAVSQLQDQYGGVVVLKGANSLVANPGTGIKTCEAGNPGMASAGMGDLLAGIIAGLLAQDLPLPIAAECGVLVHAMAGDLAAKSGERGMIASDLVPFIRRFVNPIDG